MERSSLVCVVVEILGEVGYESTYCVTVTVCRTKVSLKFVVKSAPDNEYVATELLVPKRSWLSVMLSLSAAWYWDSERALVCC